MDTLEVLSFDQYYWYENSTQQQRWYNQASHHPSL